MGGLYDEKIVKKLGTGEFMVFDTRGKCLYLIPKSEGQNWTATSQDVNAAAALVAAGKAQKFTREELTVLTEALRQIVLLE